MDVRVRLYTYLDVLQSCFQGALYSPRTFVLRSLVNEHSESEHTLCEYIPWQTFGEDAKTSTRCSESEYLIAY